MMEGAHAHFAPSSSDRWAVCQSSLAPVPAEHYVAEDDDREYAGDGSACHALGAACLNENRHPSEFLLDDRQFHKRDVTVGMVDSVSVYVDFCREFIDQGYEFFVEHRVTAHKIHEDCEGTADFRAFSEFRKHLVIVDYKSGYVYVDPKTYQGAIYAAGEMETLLDMGYEIETISVYIVQPLHKGEPIRKHDYDVKSLRKVARLLRLATQGNATKAGEHCEYCPHAHYCLALALYANEVLPNELHGPEDFDGMVTALTPEQVVEILDRQKTVKIWFAAVAKWAAQLIKLGEDLGDYEMRASEGHRRYRDVAEAERVLHEEFGDDIYEPRELRSPAQIENIWPKARSLMNGRPGKPGLTYRPNRAKH